MGESPSSGLVYWADKMAVMPSGQEGSTVLGSSPIHHAKRGKVDVGLSHPLYGSESIRIFLLQSVQTELYSAM